MHSYTQVKKGTDNREATKTLLTMREACRLLNVHGNTLRRWSAKGLVRAYRVGAGHQRRFRAEDIAALLVEPTIYGQSNARKEQDQTSRHPKTNGSIQDYSGIPQKGSHEIKLEE
jgi:excisionase family DNA binding protein